MHRSLSFSALWWTRLILLRNFACWRYIHNAVSLFGWMENIYAIQIHFLDGWKITIVHPRRYVCLHMPTISSAIPESEWAGHCTCHFVGWTPLAGRPRGNQDEWAKEHRPFVRAQSSSAHFLFSFGKENPTKSWCVTLFYLTNTRGSLQNRGFPKLKSEPWGKHSQSRIATVPLRPILP